MAKEQRLIDANEIVKVAEHAYKEWNLAMAAADGQRQINQVYKMKELCKAVRAVADAAPTVDAVPVVRCRDCKHWKPSGSMAGNSEDDLQPIGGCKWANCCRKANDFCSYGERREGE